MSAPHPIVEDADRPASQSRVLLWSFVPFITLSVIHVGLLFAHSPLAGPTKLALMPLLALPVLVHARNVRPRRAVVLLLAAILCSWLGDGAGAFFPSGPELPLMLGFFGLAHIAYITLFARNLAAQRMPWWALIYLIWWIGMVVFLGPHTGDLLIAVAAYGLVLGATAAFASRCHPMVTVGGVFFLLSDTILAFRLFLPAGMPDWTSPSVMLTYTLGQGLIVAGALLTTRERTPPQ